MIIVAALGLVALTGLKAGDGENGRNDQSESVVLDWPPRLFTELNWDPSPSEEVVGYAVYFVWREAAITNRVDVGNSLALSQWLTVGQAYLIYAVAYDEEGVESDPSNVIGYVPPPITPLRLAVSADGGVMLRCRTSPRQICRLEWTENLINPHWQFLALATADARGDVLVADRPLSGQVNRFYRALREETIRPYWSPSGEE